MCVSRQAVRLSRKCAVLERFAPDGVGSATPPSGAPFSRQVVVVAVGRASRRPAGRYGRRRRGSSAVGQQLVLERAARPAEPGGDVLQLPQPVQVDPDLRHAPAEPRAATSRRLKRAWRCSTALLLAPLPHDLLDRLVARRRVCGGSSSSERPSSSGARRLASAMSSSVTRMNSERSALLVHLARPLVLVQERDGVDQRQVLLVVAPGAGALRR